MPDTLFAETRAAPESPSGVLCTKTSATAIDGPASPGRPASLGRPGLAKQRNRTVMFDTAMLDAALKPPASSPKCELTTLGSPARERTASSADHADTAAREQAAADGKAAKGGRRRGRLRGRSIAERVAERKMSIFGARRTSLDADLGEDCASETSGGTQRPISRVDQLIGKVHDQARIGQLKSRAIASLMLASLDLSGCCEDAEAAGASATLLISATGVIVSFGTWDRSAHVLAAWNAQVPHQMHALNACEAALGTAAVLQRAQAI
eukprot:gene16734-13042_t